jgi:DGQHR domain-containing protein
LISVAAIRMQQFGVQFYQASLSANDIDKLVRFEVLSYGEQAQPVRGGRKKPGATTPSKVNWDLLEKRIASSEKAYQRAIIRRKIDELVQYYEQCRQARDLPSIAGAVIISCDEALKFEPVESGSPLGTLRVPEREGILRAIDGQHRLLALHADIDHFGGENFTVPAIIFDRLPEDHIVQMFVTINAKHTRLNASHLVSLSGRQLYRDENLAAAHDVVRALNDREDSPLYGEIKLLGVGGGRVAQAPLAQELKKLFAGEAFGQGKKGEQFREDSKKFFVNYLRQVAQVFGAAWNGRKYSIGGAPRLRPRRARRRPPSGSGARRPYRLPGNRPRNLALGPPDRRSAVRDRRRLEARRDHGRFADEGAAAGAAVPGGNRSLIWKSGNRGIW